MPDIPRHEFKDIDKQHNNEIIESNPSKFRKILEWEPSWRYKVALGAISVSSVIFVCQNLNELNKWESWNTDNHYPTPPPECMAYVDPERDLKSPEQTMIENDLTGLTESNDKEANQEPENDQVSSANKFNILEANIIKTINQFMSYSSIDREELPTNELDVKVKSIEENPKFKINWVRFDEIFHFIFNHDVELADNHYSELLSCIKLGYGFPEEVEKRDLELVIAPDTGYCIGPGRIIEAGTSSKCISHGGTPPRIELKFITTSPIDEKLMILTTKEMENEEDQAKYINELLFHESIHFWLNETGKNNEIDPDEKFVQAVEQKYLDEYGKKILNPNNPIIEYE